REKIDRIVEEHQGDPAKRVLQKNLARELTVFVHSEEEYQKAIETTEKLFVNQSAAAETLSIDDLEGMEGIVKHEYDLAQLKGGMDVVSFLAEVAIFPIKSEARKMVQQGGVSINRHKVNEVGMKLGEDMLLHGRYLL